MVNFDVPTNGKDYIHRVGRTARGAGGIGKALVFLLPAELGFLGYLKEASPHAHDTRRTRGRSNARTHAAGVQTPGPCALGPAGACTRLVWRFPRQPSWRRAACNG